MDDVKKRQLPYDAQDEEELFDDQMSVSSMTECTGLIPSAPVSEPEIDSYSAIYDIPLAGESAKAQHGLQNKKQKNRQEPSRPDKATRD